ncbi:MAG: VOC family protein [Xanthomonadaceae bacterium]|jgi:predicted enzyme related to lactoylglutathione lyase|nr:VOC family protein [Xanthomonadaceae bacterium]
MARVTGIGGIFFKARDPAALAAWYQRHLGIDLQPWGGAAFTWSTPGRVEPDGGVTVWNIMPASSTYLDPSTAPFMVNYRVDDLDALLAKLRAEGCAVDAKVERSEYGAFGWVMDPEGHRIELWQPPAGGPPGA